MKGWKSSFSDVTFISVPLLCKFTFMTGPEPHKWIAQFKPCAIRQVQVNYTPDGTYATYDGEEKGAPVATELTVQFCRNKNSFTHQKLKQDSNVFFTSTRYQLR